MGSKFLFLAKVFGCKAKESSPFTRCCIGIIKALSHNSSLLQGSSGQSSCGKGKLNEGSTIPSY